MSGNYRTFLRSPHHAWLGLLTLGAGIATLSGIGLAVGAAAYALGWIYLPDSRLFKVWLAKRKHQEAGVGTAERDEDFLKKRKRIYEGLSSKHRAAYDRISHDAADLRRIIQNDIQLSSGARESRIGHLGQLAWTYLRLCHTRTQLDRFLDSEDERELAGKIEEAERTIAGMEIADTDFEGSRLRESRQSRVDAMKQRLVKIREAESGRELTIAEQERIEELLRLQKADQLSSRNPNDLSLEIDSAVSQLDRTRTWLRDFDFDTSEDITGEAARSLPLEIER